MFFFPLHIANSNEREGFERSSGSHRTTVDGIMIAAKTISCDASRLLRISSFTLIFIVTVLYRQNLDSAVFRSFGMNDAVGDAATTQFNEETCLRSIHAASKKALDAVDSKFSIKLGLGQRRNIVDLIAKAAMDHSLKGDWVEVDGSSASQSNTTSTACELGEASFIAAVAQREALRDPACNRHGTNGNKTDSGVGGRVRKRAI